MRNVILALLIYLSVTSSKKPHQNTHDGRRAAVVTLVSGTEGGYNAGAMALGQSLVDVASKLHKICMVTEDVTQDIRLTLQSLWEVRQVPTIYCNHKVDASITGDKYDLNDERYKAGIQRCVDNLNLMLSVKFYFVAIFPGGQLHVQSSMRGPSLSLIE